MFKHLLIPTDFSDVAEKGLNMALRFSEPGHTQITLLHVIESIAHLSEEENREFYDKLEDRSRTKMGEIAQALSEKGYEVVCRQVIGKRIEQIVGIAAELQVDGVVMGSRTMDLERPTLGLHSISHMVASLAQCTVILAR
ncbi:Universal stress protein [Sulfidibacter corallicola]|uniref:Universal stress protein n=1 Tax=Sulfidibacter corallicola TaxID=2818388 RepID=A0A8A4TFV1_SULCO|nr:universal stress protein [Sulfidibacter corallicola]QTD48513.1 universal stress protein [Sulfidibacter corallicola]